MSNNGTSLALFLINKKPNKGIFKSVNDVTLKNSYVTIKANAGLVLPYQNFRRVKTFLTAR
jgi:hypothetical protein